MRKHGLSKTPTWYSWYSMRERCRNPNVPKYSRYGARGIRVCERWQDFRNFLKDMGLKPTGTSIDRINNDGNYEPANCRWANVAQQSCNKSTNRVLVVRGISKTASEWALEMGISAKTIFTRLDRGWSPEDAITRRPQRRPTNVPV